jgi:hypothetical protein
MREIAPNSIPPQIATVPHEYYAFVESVSEAIAPPSVLIPRRPERPSRRMRRPKPRWIHPSRRHFVAPQRSYKDGGEDYETGCKSLRRKMTLSTSTEGQCPALNIPPSGFFGSGNVISEGIEYALRT